MGVINLSPDSWYRESVSLSTQAAIRRGLILKAQGADIVDVGAESSLAHAARVDAALQNSRLLPVVRRLSEEGLLVSVETYQPEVTRACFEAGARILNLTGSRSATEHYRVVADYDGAVILCFVEGENVREVGDLDLSREGMEKMKDYFRRRIDEAMGCGVQKIWIDPGLGFYYRNLQDSALRIRYQIDIFLKCYRLWELGWPICNALPHAFECFEEEVRSAEGLFAVLALLGGTHLFRTHEVPKVRAVLQTLSLWP
ncbi:MAG: dihydropteroate synthase [Methylacidiphilales bacterium]|nr:dihydropteroate synthase [Candidatus Methylacidiphilales bacterium]MDW8349304.1 dihydropteroate synthase [Verrucomicrobiae bacterium]